MSGRREVNVERPEHSWIPFYRELAEKLIKDGWRERQGELVEVLKEMRNERVMMHNVLNYLDEYVDPFTVFAIIARNMTPGNYRSVLGAYKSKFGIEADLPVVKPFIPYIFSLKLGFFPGEGDIPRYVSNLWDLFELVWNTDPCATGTNLEPLAAKFDDCKSIPGVGVAKLTSVLYIVNPEAFLKNDTINDVIGQSVLTRESTGADYFRHLKSVRSEESRSFPEINVSEYTLRNDNSSKPNVWVVRGGHDGVAVDEFLTRGYSGVGFRLELHDLSKFATKDSLLQYCDERGLDDYGVDQVFRFLTEIHIGDYLLMPGRGSVVNHFGRVVSDPYHGEDGTHNNRRDVDWLKVTIPRSELDLSRYRPTLTLPNRERQEGYLAIIKRYEQGEMDDDSKSHFKLPEDSWVPFHLEVGRKLIEGEWWLEEKRDEFVSKIREIGLAVNDDDGDRIWCPEPYSFFDSLSIHHWQTGHSGGYEKVQELFGIEATLPSEEHLPYGLHWGWDATIDDDATAFLWEFFRFAVEFDPAADDTDSDQRFTEFYDRASSSVFLPGKRGGVWSYFLYWVDPTKYVLARRLSKNELGLSEDLGVSENLSTGEKYLQTLKGIAELGAQHRFTVLDVNRRSTTREMLGLEPSALPPGYTVQNMIEEDVFLERSDIERMLTILRTKKNLILQGPPGVGKTFIARKLAYVLMGSRDEKRVTSVQFHQSYSYEDFVGGFRPDVEDGQMVFTRQDGPFLEMCAAARANPDDAYVMLIDEINRGNLSRVFGELLMLIEADKRRPEFGVTLQHRPDVEEMFFVPENVYIIGTMNLADRSLTGMNVAMRRRFGFVDLKPQFNKRVFTDWLGDETEMPPDMQARINTRMADLNSAIADDASLGFNYAVGHSFFCPPEGGPAGGWEEWYKTVVDYEIRPLLREYWFDAPDKANEQADTLL